VEIVTNIATCAFNNGVKSLLKIMQ